MTSDIWFIEVAREETRYHHYIGYTFRLAAREILYAPSHHRIVYITAFVTPVVEHWLERELVVVVVVVVVVVMVVVVVVVVVAVVVVVSILFIFI